MTSVGDPLDEILHLESQFYEEGRIEGDEHREQHQYEQGLQFGVKQGRDVALELGQMHGYCLVMKMFLRARCLSGDGDHCRIVSSARRLLKTVDQIEDLLHSFPKTREQLFVGNSDDNNDSDGGDGDALDVRQRLDQLRSQFKLLNVRWNMLAKQWAKKTVDTTAEAATSSSSSQSPLDF